MRIDDVDIVDSGSSGKILQGSWQRLISAAVGRAKQDLPDWSFPAAEVRLWVMVTVLAVYEEALNHQEDAIDTRG